MRGIIVWLRRLPWLLALGACGRFGFTDRPDSAADTNSMVDVVDGPAPIVFLYSMDRGTTNLHIFSVDLTSGAIAETGMLAVGGIPWFAVPSPRGTALYVGSRQTATIYTLRVDMMTGALTLIDQDPAAAAIAMGAVRPDASALYVAREIAGMGVYGYAIAADDTLTPIAGSPWSHGGGPTNGIAVHPMGRWVMALADGVVHVFESAPVSGGLTLMPFSWDSTDFNAWDIVIDAQSKFGFLSPELTQIPGFTIDEATGMVSTTPGSPFASGGFTALDADITGSGHLVVASNSSDTVSAYTIDRTTGAIAHVPGSPYALSTTPWGVTASPVGNLFFVADVFSDNILTFQVDDQGLAQRAPHPITPNPEQLVIVRTR